MKLVAFSLEQGSRYYGRIDGQRFFIGRRVVWQGRRGLMNAEGVPAQRYQPDAHRAEHGHWADWILPIALAEGGHWHTLNTYDRAHFTFGFLQYAAHVPDGDFVRLLRALLALPAAAAYFPDLTLTDDGRVGRIGDDAIEPLETPGSTAALMRWLNPTTEAVEDTEVIQAAKFVHWAHHDPSHRAAQVACGVAHLRAALAAQARRHGLDGADDIVCLLVADIRHQGRGRGAEIDQALARPDPAAALLRIGADRWPQRVETLRRAIARLVDEGRLGRLRYSLARQDFVDGPRRVTGRRSVRPDASAAGRSAGLSG